MWQLVDQETNEPILHAESNAASQWGTDLLTVHMAVLHPDYVVVGHSANPEIS